MLVTCHDNQSRARRTAPQTPARNLAPWLLHGKEPDVLLYAAQASGLS